MTMLTEYGFTTARANLTSVIDQVMDKEPQVIKARKQSERDVLLIDVEMQKELLIPFQFTVDLIEEEDGSITAGLDALTLYVNQPAKEEALSDLAQEMMDYAQTFIEKRDLYLSAPNRRHHLGYVMRILLCHNEDEVRQLLCLRSAS